MCTQWHWATGMQPVWPMSSNTVPGGAGRGQRWRRLPACLAHGHPGSDPPGTAGVAENARRLRLAGDPAEQGRPRRPGMSRPGGVATRERRGWGVASSGWAWLASEAGAVTG